MKRKINPKKHLNHRIILLIVIFSTIFFTLIISLLNLNQKINLFSRAADSCPGNCLLFCPQGFAIDSKYTCNDHKNCCRFDPNYTPPPTTPTVTLAPTTILSPTPLTKCPGRCISYWTEYDRKRRQPTPPTRPTLAPGNNRDIFINDCYLNQDPSCTEGNRNFGIYNGCNTDVDEKRDSTTGIKPNFDEQPFYDLSSTCPGNKLLSRFNIREEKLEQICCADYETYRYSQISTLVITPSPSPTPILTCRSSICVSSATSSCYLPTPTPTRRIGLSQFKTTTSRTIYKLSPTPTPIYKTALAPTACPSNNLNYCCVVVTPTARPFTPSPTPTDFYCDPSATCRIIVGNSTACKTGEYDLNTDCKIFNSSIGNYINGSCCQLIPTTNPTPSICPVDHKCLSNCSNDPVYNTDIGKIDPCKRQIFDKHCCIALPTPINICPPNACELNPCNAKKVDLGQRDCGWNSKCCVEPTPGPDNGTDTACINAGGACREKYCQFGEVKFGEDNCKGSNNWFKPMVCCKEAL